MSTLSHVLRTAERIPIDRMSKIILMSDCHRGTGSRYDDFLKNRHIFAAALTYYLQNGFTYMELGDGEELWENRSATKIKEAHSDIYALMEQFAQRGRLQILYGNHDITKNCRKLGFENVSCRAGIVLCGADNEIFLVHGHQGDIWNDSLWRVARFLVRYVWRPLETIGLQNPTSTSSNTKRKNRTERRLSAWCTENGKLAVFGHTHRPVLPPPGQGLYCNCGSCVHPYCVTGIEIANGLISLVRWTVKTNSENFLYVDKETIAGPYDITLYH